MTQTRFYRVSFQSALVAALGMFAFNLSAVAQALRPPTEQVLEISGNSLKEKKAQWLWNLLPLVTKACRAQPSCQMTAEEKVILDQIILNLPHYNRQSLQFLSEKENPGTFTSDQNEAHRIAVTGNSPQSKIVLNLDRLDSLSWSQLLAILGHEIVHHTGVVDDEKRIPDQIGAKISRYFEINSVNSSLEEYGHPEIQALYFGVNVPESTDYFQIFPVPTVRVDAKVALLDAHNVYDIDTYESYAPFHCVRIPGSAFVNEQVSDPKIHVNRWFPGDSEISVSMNVLVQDVCLIVAHAPDADMKGSQAVGQLSLQLKLENPSVQNWKESALKIRGDFIRVTLRPRSDEENPELANLAKVEKIISAPATVNAGGTYKLQLQVRFQDPQSALVCDAPFTADSWHSLDMTSLVPFFNFDRCRAEKQGSDLYLMTLESDIPSNAFPGTYGVDTVGMIRSSNEEMVTAPLPQRVRFEVINLNPPVAPKILSYQFVGVGSGKLIPDKIYDFEVRIENADFVYSSFVSGRFVETSGHHVDFVEEIAHSKQSMFQFSSYRKEGNILIATYKALVPGRSQNASIRRIELYTMNYQTKNWGEAYLDLRQKPAVFEVAGD